MPPVYLTGGAGTHIDKEQNIFNHLNDMNYYNTKRRRDGNAGKKDKENNKEKNR